MPAELCDARAWPGNRFLHTLRCSTIESDLHSSLGYVSPESFEAAEGKQSGQAVESEEEDA